MFKALWVTENPDKTYSRTISMRELDSLPKNDTLVRVRYSSLNYKDALSASGNKGVTRAYPHTPGIDAVGEIVESADVRFKKGDSVIVTSYDLGMNTSGGFAQYIRVPSAWVVPMPSGLTPREAMIFGTAGFTAALSVHRIIEREGIVPDRGEVLVTGASGGVGCLAVAMLGKLGYNVVAGTGKLDQADWLKQVGATSVISREELDDKSGRPLMKPRWAAVVDTVGGNILASAIKTTQMNGCVTACGLVQSSELHGTVFPFILRGVNLCGIDSGETKMPLRAQMWGRLAGEWKPSPQTLDAITTECALDDINTHIDTILRGGVRGRVVVRVD